ncbi:MAG: hypothetical protein SFV22_01060 [Saprospiraceae bacterium]|nr:hypothetical protein [Saprospiraceae bacterium]
MNNKISRRHYRRVPQSALIAYSENILIRTRDVAQFAFLQNEVKALETPLEQYRAALAAALNGGRAEIAQKNNQLKALIAALDAVANSLEAHAESSQTMILDAGFSVVIPPARIETPETPEIQRISSTGRKGELLVLLNDADPRAVLTHGIEYSDDQGQTWKNGIYRNQRRFILTDLPSSPQLFIRIRSIGRADRLSKWSDPVLTAVL